jgi:hypothetical protein
MNYWLRLIDVARAQATSLALGLRALAVVFAKRR